MAYYKYNVGDFIKETGKHIWYSYVLEANDELCNVIGISDFCLDRRYHYYCHTMCNIEIITKYNNPEEFEICEKLLSNYYKIQVFK